MKAECSAANSIILPLILPGAFLMIVGSFIFSQAQDKSLGSDSSIFPALVDVGLKLK